MNAYIKFEQVDLSFRRYHNPYPTMKEIFVSIIHKQKRATQITEFQALKNINLDIHSGDKLGIIGLNGAGKSTLLKVIAGIYPPSNGRVTVSGQVTPMIELGTGMDVELSGRENIYINGALLGISKQEMINRQQEIIDFSELSEFIDMPVKYYSSGMFSRLVFSIGTMVDPEILIIDEIFSSGDALFIEKATKRMEKLLDDSQIVLFVSHTLDLIQRICNRVIVMNKGEIVNDGQPEQMIDFYLNNVIIK